MLGPLLLNSRYYFQPRAGADRCEFSRGSRGPAIKHRPCGKRTQILSPWAWIEIRHYACRSFIPCPHFCFSFSRFERPVTCLVVLVIERAVRKHDPNWSIIGNRSALSRGNRWVLPCVPLESGSSERGQAELPLSILFSCDEDRVCRTERGRVTSSTSPDEGHHRQSLRLIALCVWSCLIKA